MILLQMLDQAARMEVAKAHGNAMAVHSAHDVAEIDTVKLERNGWDTRAVTVRRFTDDAAVVASGQPGQQEVGQQIFVSGDPFVGGGAGWAGWRGRYGGPGRGSG